MKKWHSKRQNQFNGNLIKLENPVKSRALKITLK